MPAGGGNRKKKNPPTRTPSSSSGSSDFDENKNVVSQSSSGSSGTSRPRPPPDPLTQTRDRGSLSSESSGGGPNLTPSTPQSGPSSEVTPEASASCSHCPIIDNKRKKKNIRTLKKGALSSKKRPSTTRARSQVKGSRKRAASSSKSVPAKKKGKPGVKPGKSNKKKRSGGAKPKSCAGGSSSSTGTATVIGGAKPDPPVINRRRERRGGAAGGGGGAAGGAGGGGGGGGGDDRRAANLDKANSIVVDFQRQIELFLQMFNELLDRIQRNLMDHPPVLGNLVRLNVNRFRFGFVQFHARQGLERLHHDVSAAFTTTDTMFADMLRATGSLSAMMNSWLNHRMFRGYRFLYGNVAAGILRERIQTAQARSVTLAARMGIGGQWPDINPTEEFEVRGEGDGLIEERNAAGGQNGQPLNRAAFILRQGYNQAMGSRFINEMGYLRARLEIQLLNVQNVSHLTTTMMMNMMLLNFLQPNYDLPEDRSP